MVATGTTHTVVVLTALECEYEAVRTHLNEPRSHRHPAGTLFEVGSVPGGEIVLVLVGAGNQGAAALTERAITEFRPHAVLFVGIAGALHTDMALGTVVVATKIYGYHGGIEQDRGFGARPQAWDSDHELEQTARLVSRSPAWCARLPGEPPQVLFRPIAAGEVVLNSRDTPLAQQLRDHYSDSAAIEMESAGMAKAAHLNRAPCLTIRGISDHADGQKHAADRAGWQAEAARNAAALAMAVARAVLPPSDPPGKDRLNGSTPVSGEATPGWQPLRDTVDVTWRADLIHTRFTTERAALEVHIIPLGDRHRLQMRRLIQLTEELPAHGRTHDLFTSTEQLAVEHTDRVAWVRSTDHHRGPRGLAVSRNGQRTTWSPLPYDVMGPVLDPEDLPQQINRSLRLLLSLDDLPEPDRVTLAMALEPATLITEDSISSFPRTRASGMRMLDHLRIPPEDTLTYPWLSMRTEEVAEELAARLVTAFRATR